MANLPPAQKTILIVDDEPSLRAALADKLRLEGFQTLTAEDGQAGLALALDQHPDLILLDIIMPKLNGIDMLKALRSNDWGKTAEVMLLTNAGDLYNVNRAFQLKTYDVLDKANWSLEKIVQKIRQKLGLV